MTVRTIRIVVEGRVQGVGFRAFVAREAARCDAVGFVRNLSDGRVEAVARGSPDAVAALSEACGRGPIGSRVTRVDIVDHTDKLDQSAGFVIARDA